MTVHHTIMPADQETLAGWKQHFAEASEQDRSYHTCAEIAGSVGISPRAMQQRLAKMIEKGEVLVAKAYRVDIFDRRMLVPVYKLVPKPKRRGKK